MSKIKEAPKGPVRLSRSPAAYSQYSHTTYNTIHEMECVKITEDNP